MSNLSTNLSTIEVSSITIALGSLNKKLDDLTPLYDQWADYMKRIIDRSFDEERSPAGQPWEALTPRYRERKERHAKRKVRALGLDKRGNPVSQGRRILQWSGNLRSAALKTQVRSGVLEIGEEVRVGRWSLGAIHQFGAPRAEIPARPYLPIDSQGRLLPETRQELTRMVIEYLTR